MQTERHTLPVLQQTNECPLAGFQSGHNCHQALQEAERTANRLRLQSEAGLRLLGDEDPHAAVAAVLQLVAESFDCEWSGVWTIPPGGRVFLLDTAWHRERPELQHFRQASRQAILRAHAGPLTTVADEGRVLCFDDYAAVAQDRVGAARRAGLRAWWGAPLLGSGHVIGVWELFPRTSVPLDAPQRECLAVVALKLGRYLERHQVMKALGDSEQRYRQMFENNPRPMFVMDRESLRFLAVNCEALSLYGYTEQEFLAMRGTDIRPAGDLPAFMDHVKAVKSSGASGVHHRRGLHLTKSGKAFDVEVTEYHVLWNGRHAQLAMITDLTERLTLERERDEMELHMRHAQKLEAIGQLAAGVAHEINTPSQYVGDNLKFLQDSVTQLDRVLLAYEKLATAVEASGEVSPELAEALDSVRQAAREADVEYLQKEAPLAIEQALDGISQVATIVGAMKEFSHPSKKEKAPADLNRALANTVVVSRNEWKYGADLVTDFDPALPQVPCLVSEINQVVLNLIVNAAHAIQDRGSEEKGRITVRTRRDGDWAEIQVADTGNGIPEAIRNRIFEPFFTTKDVGRGTGQGLAIARSIVVDKHGGDIHFTTETGAGTTFFIRLPLSFREEQ